jgi:hypothetical protein
MLVFIVFIGCGSEAPPPPEATDVRWEGRTVADALAGLDARLDAVEEARGPEVDAAAIAAIDARLSHVEQLLLQGQAEAVAAGRPTEGYTSGTDSRTTVASIEARLDKLEDRVFSSNFGEPGSGLFEVPKGSPGGKGGRRPPGGAGPGGQGSPSGGTGTGGAGPGGGGPGGGSGNGPPGPPPSGGGPGGPPPG